MKKLLTACLAGLLLLSFMAKSALAATVDAINEAQSAQTYSDQTYQPTLESHVQNTFTQLQVNIFQSTMGGYPEVDEDGDVSYSTGMVGDMTTGIAWMMGNPAASTERYVADVLNSAGVGIVQPAYAQGLGFASLDPILDTWKTFRNIAYLMFVIIFLVIGFLIMLRQKVGGQTAVTAQQAIPSIIVALLLVTFSYAIAGLMIDLMYLVMYLILALFNQDQGTFLNKNFIALGLSMISKGFTSANEVVSQFAGSLDSSLGNFGKTALLFIGGLTMATVVAVAIALQVFKLFFELLKTYVSIILSIAFAPVILAVGAIPGKDTFKQWMIDLIGNLASFPVVLLVLILFEKLTENAETMDTGGFQPPFLFGQGTAGFLPFIVGLGMLMIMPEIVKEAKKAIGVKEGIFATLSRNIGESLKGGWKGGELIPGLAISDTSKWPMGGISGENLVRKGGIGASAVLGGIPYGVARHISRRVDGYPNTRGALNFAQGVWKGMKDTAIESGGLYGDKQINREAVEKRQEAMKKKAQEGKNSTESPETTGRSQL